MQKRVLDFINLKNASGFKNSFRIIYGGGTKKEKTVFLHLVWGGRRRYGSVERKSLQTVVSKKGVALLKKDV